MAQCILLIHGRSTKPAQDPHIELQKTALIDGLMRADPGKAEKVRDGTVRVEAAYYGDINNAILGAQSARTRRKLTVPDPARGGAMALPTDGLPEGLDALRAIPKFSKAAYSRIVRDNRDLRFIDDAARAISTIAAITTATFLNEKVIASATADLGAYLLTHQTGSDVRDRLQRPLKRAIEASDDICLVSHSMGCIVAYDVLWKFSRMSEYREYHPLMPIISKWITLGSPLGEAGVKANLRDAREHGDSRFPKNAVKDWVNIAARDDFIAHDPTAADDFRGMKRHGFVDSITDKRIWNCWAADGTSNSHKFYGYLGHDVVGQEIADWIA